MNSDQWNVVSEWLGEWIDADPARREELRGRLAADHPALLPEAVALAGASGEIGGFLETPALILEAPALVIAEALLPAGTAIGPYEIETLLGRGGTGDVYRAFDTRLRRHVALKVLAQSRTSDSHRVDRFMHEARVTASLDHPHVVRVHDVGCSDGHVYLVAEWLEGETLRDRIARGPVPIGEAIRIAIQTAEGLSAAHAAGLIHRDLKPDNIFLTAAGGAKILDFGIAKLAPESSAKTEPLTMTGVILGTAGYLAPEQIRGASIDVRADLFALGVVLFEMLSGERAFDRGHLVDTLHSIMHDPPADALHRRDDVPGDLVSLVMSLLSKTPEARPASAREVITALHGIDRGLSAAEPEPRTVSRRATPRRTSLAHFGWAAAVVIIGTGVVITGWMSSRRSSLPAEPMKTASSVPGPEAQEKFLLGSAAARRVTPEDLRVAVRYFEEAIAIAPNYAEAWAGLASAYKRMPVTGAASSRVAFEKARAAAERALALDRRSADAVSTLGTVAFWYDWDYGRAQALLEQALALDPTHADSLVFLAILHDSQGRFAEALTAIRRAQMQDRQWAQLRALEGYFLMSARRYEDALKYLDAVIRDIDPAMWTTQMYRADVLMALGRGKEALAAYEAVRTLTPHPLPASLHGAALARLARRREAEATLAGLPLDFQYGRAIVLEALGRYDEAIAALGAAIEDRHTSVTSLGIDAQWDRLRAHPGFRDLARRVNLLEVSDRMAGR